MTRFAAYLLGLAAVAAVACLPVAFYDSGRTEPQSETTTITSYVADFAIDADGDMSVTEKISVRFPESGKHGIFRFWDRDDELAPHVRRQPHDLDVTRDGGDEPFDLSYEKVGRYRVAKIGDADVTVDPGVHTYVLRYRMDDVVIPGRSGDTDLPGEFQWDLVPGGWQQRIERASLVVHLPVDAPDRVDCAVGFDSDSGCSVRGAGTRTLRVSVSGLAARTPVTLRTGLDVAPADVDQLPWTTRWDAVLGRSVDDLALVGLLTLLVAVGAGILGGRTRETTPALPLVYAPPDGIGPAQAAYVLDEKVDRTTYVATLMYAAERGAVDLRRDDDTWSITDKSGAAGWEGLDPVTFGTAHLLGGPGSTFTATKKDVTAGQRLQTEIASFTTSTTEWGETTRTVVKSFPAGWAALVWFLALIAAVLIVAVNPFTMTAWALVPAAFVICGHSATRSGAGTRRTPEGRELWSRTGGFRRVLSTPSSKDRFDFSGRQELYTAYLPWAVAFGCADAWAEKYRTEMGSEPPVPSYFGGYYAGSTLTSGVDSMVGDFSATVDSAISSYSATQSSSSGGGFGGGGGGGGGGGSW